MNVFTQFTQILLQYGLEYYNKYYGIYEGFVHDNKDPEFMGRLIVEVPTVYAQNIPDYWAHSKGMFAGANKSFFAIPDIGDPVWISFKNGDSRYPIWEYGWFGEKDVPEQARREDPTNAVFQFGKHRMEFDQKNARVRITNAKGYVIEMNNDGIHLGQETKGDEPAVLGDTTQKYLEDILQALVEATVTVPGGAVPLNNLATFAALKLQASNIKSSKITLIK